LSLGFASVALAHEDDPKLLDLQPFVPGPGWLRDGGGPQPDRFTSHNVTLMSWISIGDFGNGATAANDCWGYVSGSGREYAIIGLSNATTFVEVTNPGAATIVARISGPTSTWRDIKTYQNYAYAVSEGGSGIQVMDLANIDSGTVTLVNTITSGGTAATHNVALDTTSGFLYRCGGDNNGLRIYSLANPANPTFVGSWSERYVHDAQVVTYTSGPYAGRQIAFCCSGFNGGFDQTGLDVVDVTNKANPVVLSRTFYPSAGYSHQGWLSPDRQYFYLDDELDESSFGIATTTRVIDVSDLDAPVAVATYTNGNPSIDHNLYTRSAFTYAANYRSGLRVFDRANPLAPVEVAWFDTYDADDNPSFNGMWSNYPYLPSAIVIGSDIERGLFVFRVDIPLSFSFPDGLPSEVDPAGGDTLRVVVNGEHGGALESGSVSFHVDTGAGFVALPVDDLGGGEFLATFPAATCGDPVRYYFSAGATSGQVMTSPAGAPVSFYQAVAVAATIVEIEDDMETDIGWVVGAAGDDATTGVWTRVDPVGTSAQPEDDHTAGGTMCWVTGQGAPGGNVGDNDVDGGRTTLRSPQYDLSTMIDPRIGYWRWYNNSAGASPNADIFEVEISNGGGWLNVETVGPTGPETSGGWFYHEFRVADFVVPNDVVRIRFIASDEGSGSIVEAAVDDLSVFDFDCDAAPCPGDLDGSGTIDLGDLSIVLANYGTQSGATAEQGDLNGDGDVDLEDLAAILAIYGSTCP